MPREASSCLTKLASGRPSNTIDPAPGIVKARDTVEERRLARAVRAPIKPQIVAAILTKSSPPRIERLVATDLETRAQEEFREVVP